MTTDLDDVVIVAAYRTPNSKADRGNFRNLKNDQLIAAAMEGTLRRAGVDPALVEDVVVGHVLSPMNGTVALRMAAMRIGIPTDVPVSTTNRQCGSGLDSISIIADRIRLGKIQIGLAGGFESMSSHKLPTGYDLSRPEDDATDAGDCFLSMGETSEILAEQYKITREEADEAAYESHRRALWATEAGLFLKEMIPVEVEGKMVTCDDGIREPDMEKMSRLRPVFRESGISTAGNSSQLSDGAAAVLLMSKSRAEELRLPVLGTFVDYLAVGVRPCLMGEGPVLAIRKLLERNGLTLDQVGYFEINEAFASQYVHCLKKLGISGNNVNLYGGAIALGHPVGCSGARLVCTLLNVMKNEEIQGYGVVSLCVGSGLGVAALIRK
jgi:acetyl-CoA acyltransferase 1